MISFIIPAYNEEKFIGPAVSSIVSAARALALDYEVIVVDDDSTDATAQIAQGLGARVVAVKLRKISAVRNAGAKAAKGDRFIFVDADTMVSAPLVRAAVRAMARGAVGGGAMVGYDHTPHLWAKALLKYWNMMSRFSRWAAGCFVFVRRDAFEKVGGFNESYFAAEELILSEELKKIGRFSILLENSLTSSRKTVQYSFREIFSLSLRLIMGGKQSWQRREGLDIWYVRRPDQLAP